MAHMNMAALLYACCTRVATARLRLRSCFSRVMRRSSCSPISTFARCGGGVRRAAAAAGCEIPHLAGGLLDHLRDRGELLLLVQDLALPGGLLQPPLPLDGGELFVFLGP
jgi:hypothetical protein